MKENIKAILFDLDGTLIDVDLKKFIPGYVKLLAAYTKEYVSTRKLVAQVMEASNRLENNNGEKTNEAVFNEFFFPLDGRTREELEPIFMQFYREDFNKLKKYTRKKPEARPTVQKAFDKGYKVAIATTPILPEIGVQKRLEWAGVGDFEYDLITSYEYVTATKPNLKYYEDIAEILKVTPEQCLMIGDEEKDMVAKDLGCSTFLIRSQNTELSSETPKPDYEGDLTDLQNLL
ncbi:MAG: HAD family hydrolase [Promethearchaeota archaeon]|nr:MAG: HAD family hydrolase [Candidatus Lokiarchaeota archaeon]